MQDRVTASIVFESLAFGRAGPERMRVLAAVAETGSISAAARRLGMSYRGAWDAVNCLNNLFDRPLVAGTVGGAKGGGAVLTRAGDALLAQYHALQTDLDQALAALKARLDEAAADGEPTLAALAGLSLQTSAANAWRGAVEAVTVGAVEAEVRLRLTDGVGLTVVAPARTVAAMALAPGRAVVALVNPSLVILAPAEEARRTSARNRLIGVVMAREDGAVSSEITLDLGDGKTLAAAVTLESAEALDLKPGDRACALIKASHVTLLVA